MSVFWGCRNQVHHTGRPEPGKSTSPQSGGHTSETEVLAGLVPPGAPFSAPAGLLASSMSLAGRPITHLCLHLTRLLPACASVSGSKFALFLRIPGLLG